VPSEAELLASLVQDRLPFPWPAYPGGWPGEIEAALIDAVFSIRARYGGKDSGVRAVVARWRDHRGVEALDELECLSDASSDELLQIMNNRQRLSGDGYKTDALRAAASNLVAVGVHHAADLDPTSRSHRGAYIRVPGLGPVTWEYFSMLLGTPGIKADTWIRRFAEEALGRAVSSEDASKLLRQVADVLEEDPRALDYAIWRHMRSR
jgi:hypothetical protein